jgi:ectoine hydroxylase-related dioxygenase (phytanoyl-CoA dioxygenase family)
MPDVALDNGWVWAAPGLHRRGTLEHHFVDPLGWQVFEQPPVPPVAVPVPAGGAVVFSSLTPHLTGANTSDAVRKAYIVQYMPDGALLYEGGPAAPVVMDDDERYPWVLRGGRSIR